MRETSLISICTNPVLIHRKARYYQSGQSLGSHYSDGQPCRFTENGTAGKKIARQSNWQQDGNVVQTANGNIKLTTAVPYSVSVVIWISPKTLLSTRKKMLSGESGKVSAKLAPTQYKPTFSRPILGADSDLFKSLT